MSTKSKLKRIFKFVQKIKKPWLVPKPTRNWLDLPPDIMLNILQRVGVVDILQNAQKVCTAWRDICKDPVMWRVIYIDYASPNPYEKTKYREMCKRAVDRSQGQLLDLTVIDFCDNDLLQYIVDRSSQLRRLEIVQYVDGLYEYLSEVFKKLPLLEELSFLCINICKENIEAAGRYCPLLKTLKVNKRAVSFWEPADDSIALAIGKNLPKLTQLQLIGNSMTNTGLLAILDGCCHLEYLDLCLCFHVGLKGDLGKRCSQQIKHLKDSNNFYDFYDGRPHYYYFPSLRFQ